MKMQDGKAAKESAAFRIAEKQVADCVESSGLTRVEWFKLPLTLRVEWWRATEYGRKPPTPELIAKLRASVPRD